MHIPENKPYLKFECLFMKLAPAEFENQNLLRRRTYASVSEDSK